MEKNYIKGWWLSKLLFVFSGENLNWHSITVEGTECPEWKGRLNEWISSPQSLTLKNNASIKNLGNSLTE